MDSYRLAPTKHPIVPVFMKPSVLFLLFSQVKVILGIVCPSGYTEYEDKTWCYTGVFSASDRNQAYDLCASSGGYLYDATNAFINNWVAIQTGSSSASIWLGMTCTSNQITSCSWDGSQINITEKTFTKFYPGMPDPKLGPCVAMQISSQMWFSADCSNSNYVFGCKYSPQYTVEKCSQNPTSSKSDGEYVATFRGKCYYAITVDSNIDEANTCRNNCGQPTSIHSDGENSFSVGLAISYQKRLQKYISDYILTGLIYQNGRYSWADGSIVDYNAFELNNTALGSCVSLAIANAIVLAGYWASSPCTSTQSLNFGICQKPLNNSCDGYITPIPTQSPTQCQSTAYYKSGSGQIYSPGYPLGSEANQCEYVITEDQEALATITFERLQLDQFSSIQLFDSFGLTPFASISNTNVTGKKYQSGTNLLRIVYYTPGSQNYLNLWKADYKPESISTTISPLLNSLSCTFILDWQYRGITSNPQTSSYGYYIRQEYFIAQVAARLFDRTDLIFAANYGFYGSVDSRQCGEPIVQSDFIHDLPDFQYPLITNAPSINCPSSLCDGLMSINQFISSQNSASTCLVVLSGESSSQFNACPVKTFSQYDYIIGAAIGSEGVSTITPNVVLINDSFSAQDVNNLVETILLTVGVLTSTTSQPTTSVYSTEEEPSSSVGSILPPVPISCSFILDWDYLGFNATEYIKQRDFVDTVANQLYGSSSVIFRGNTGSYGNIDSNDCFFSIIYSDYYIDAASFGSYLTSKTPSTDCPLDLCDALDSLNDFTPGSTPQLSCLVFFSGGSDDFTACGYPIDKTRYNVVIGAALSVSEISDHLVNISSNFDQNDVKTLVNQIIYTASSFIPPPPAPINCSFILDWDYLGFNTTEYIKQRDFVDTVANQLYGSSSVIFGGNTGFYGNIDSNDCFFSIINSDYYIDAASFDSYLTSKTPSTDCPLDLCDALNSLNDFAPGSTPQLACLVFFSGGSDDFTACGYPIDKTKYNVVIGAALSANTKVSEISDHLVNISNNFDQNDVKTLVNQIISVAQQKS